MKIEVLFFGQLTDSTGCSKLVIDYVDTTDNLKKIILEKFPALSSSKFAIAVNNQMITGNISIAKNSSIAFMPPFSGG
ncbi:MoaD/ThiS family protein [Flavobacterium sp. RSP29]|uniref:MoaD/ThiS family protein n=1 Tax=unclassified Flavobacterium TaxID=196869 RepID=UPI003AAD230A